MAATRVGSARESVFSTAPVNKPRPSGEYATKADVELTRRVQRFLGFGPIQQRELILNGGYLVNGVRPANGRGPGFA